MASIAITAAAVTAAAGVGSAVEQRQAGVAQSKQYRRQALVEQQSATQKQIDMRQKMLAGLAAQNAGTLGAVGTGVGTGFGANAMRQITQQQNDLMVNSANSSAQVSLLDAASTNASDAGTANALGGLASTTGTFLASPGGKAAI